MDRDIQQLRKRMSDSLLESKEELLKEYIKKALESTNIDKHVKVGKLNTNSLVSQIKNELSKVVAEINKIK